MSDTQNLITRQTELSANIVALCRFLRQKGFIAGAREEVDALQALSVVPFETRHQMMLALKAVLPKSRIEVETFEGLYQEYWDNLKKAVDSKMTEKPEESSDDKSKDSDPRKKPPSLNHLKNWLQGKTAVEEEEVASYSDFEVLTRRNFSTFSEEEMHHVMRIIRLVAKTLMNRQTRRYEAARSRGQFDVRRTVRNNMRKGGEMFELAWRRRKIQRLKMVLLCDVSKSMDLYSRFLIQFIYGFQALSNQVDTFVFSTLLHRVTDKLRGRKIGPALERLAEDIPDWSGGTRIGASLVRFMDDFGNQKLDRRTIVIILSDGWDTGDIEVLADAMRRIRQKSARIIWLNPLAGSAEFEPKVRGMQAALPYIDVFAPCHNIESLQRLAGHLVTARKRKRIDLRENMIESR